MIGELLVLASLVRADPSGDAHGAGQLVPPTAAVHSSSAPFDLTEVAVLEGNTLTLLVRLADRPNPGNLPNGITLPIIDVYLDSEEGGAEELLPGPSLRMPDEEGWEVAVRVTGDRAYAVRSGDALAVQHAVTVTPDGHALLLSTPFPALERARIHAVTGVYDSFGPEPWRPLSREPSPWSFSSETPAPPVVDVLAEDDAAQRTALAAGVLPSAARTRDVAAPWLVLMVLGVGIAAGGLLLRGRAMEEEARDAEPEPAAADADASATGDTEAASGDPRDDAAPSDRGAWDELDLLDAEMLGTAEADTDHGSPEDGPGASGRDVGPTGEPPADDAEAASDRPVRDDPDEEEPQGEPEPVDGRGRSGLP